MDASDLDRRVTFLQRATSQDATYGTRVEGNWAPFDTVYAQVQDMLPSKGERIAEGVSAANRPCRVRIRHRDDITSAMRLSVEGRPGTWRIVTQPAEIGRREWLELVAEQLTTEGQEP